MKNKLVDTCRTFLTESAMKTLSVAVLRKLSNTKYKPVGPKVMEMLEKIDRGVYGVYGHNGLGGPYIGCTMSSKDAFFVIKGSDIRYFAKAEDAHERLVKVIRGKKLNEAKSGKTATFTNATLTWLSKNNFKQVLPTTRDKNFKRLLDDALVLYAIDGKETPLVAIHDEKYPYQLLGDEGRKKFRNEADMLETIKGIIKHDDWYYGE